MEKQFIIYILKGVKKEIEEKIRENKKRVG